MLTRIQARNYRCLKHVDQQLSHFDILVGGNGVGKSTFFDVVTFLSELVRQPRDGAGMALANRTKTFHKLLFDEDELTFTLGVRAQVPERISAAASRPQFASDVHFEITISYDESVGSRISKECLIAGDPKGIDSVLKALNGPTGNDLAALTHWAECSSSSHSIGLPIIVRGGGNVVYQAEGRNEVLVPGPADSHVKAMPEMTIFRLGDLSSGLANLPEDTERFPVATWFRQVLIDSVANLTLDPKELRRPISSLRKGNIAGQIDLPATIDVLKKNNVPRFEDWLRHLRVALTDLSTISIHYLDESRERYLVAEYVDGRKVPSWLLSDGTLRLIGLTLPAYAMDDGRILLIEEPENCIHPLAIEVVMQSLSSMYESQVFVTTHSPAILSLAEPESILCFSKSVEEGTSIVRGTDHPRLSEWKKSIDLGTLLASGILG